MAQAALKRADLHHAKKLEAFEQAKAELDKAEAEWHAANDELEHVRAEAETFAQPDPVEEDDPQVAARAAAAELLAAVEQTWPSHSGPPPEHLLGVMKTARRALEVASSPLRSRVSAAPGSAAPGDADMPEAKASPEVKAPPKLAATPKIQARPLPERAAAMGPIAEEPPQEAKPAAPAASSAAAASTAAGEAAQMRQDAAAETAAAEAAAAQQAAQTQNAQAQNALWAELLQCDDAEGYNAIVKKHIAGSRPY
jgi:Predicted membrane protein